MRGGENDPCMWMWIVVEDPTDSTNLETMIVISKPQMVISRMQ